MPTHVFANGNIDWRTRPSTTLADLYDGDRHLILSRAGTKGTPAIVETTRDRVRIPHPIPGATYADGSA